MSDEIIGNSISKKDLETVIQKFGFEGDFVDATPIKAGHINETVLVTLEQGRKVKKYIFQAINTLVFKNPVAVMENISAVTKHIRRKYDEEGVPSDRHVLKFYKTVEDDRYYYVDQKNHFWRVYKFIDNSSTYNEAEDTKLIYNSGLAFGKFQRRLADFPMDKLNEIIPDFHNTEARFQQLEKAIAEDLKGRASGVREEIDFFLARKSLASKLVRLQREGLLPLRVTHNDTKCNNVLIDDDTGDAICVIDLDTVMPGLSAYDFGDAIRSCSNSAAEDEPDLRKVYFKIENFEAFAKGFIEASGGFFTEMEIDNMAWGAVIMTMECGSRFLTDYLNGDTYFRISREGQNLDRARTQIKLVKDMEKQIDRMNQIVKDEAAKCNQ